jgi:hypothetical protein
MCVSVCVSLCTGKSEPLLCVRVFVCVGLI